MENIFLLWIDESMLSWQQPQLWNIWKRLLRGIKSCCSRESMKCRHLRWAIHGFQMVLSKKSFIDCKCQLLWVGGESGDGPLRTMWISHLIHSLFLPANLSVPQSSEESRWRTHYVKTCLDLCWISSEWTVNGASVNCLGFFFCIGDLWQWDIKFSSFWKYLHIVLNENYFFICLLSVDKEKAARCG